MIALRVLFEDSPALVALLDGQTQAYTFANAAYRATFFEGADPVGRTLAQLLPEADTQGFVDIIHGVYASGEPFEAHEIGFSLSLPDGSAKALWFNLIFKPVRGAHGRIDSTLIVATDVTEAVVNRELASTNKRQLQIALESGRMGSWRIDLNTGILTADDTFRALHHANDTEQIQDAISRIGHPDDQPLVRAALQRTIGQGAPYDVEYRIVTAHGEVQWVTARGNAVFDDTGRTVAVTGVAFNIQQRKTAELATIAARARDAYFLRLDDALRSSVDASALQATATTLLGEQLQAARIWYTEFDVDKRHALVDQQYSGPGMAPVAGTWDTTAFAAYMRALQAGPVVLSNVAAASFLTDGERTALAAMQVNALLSVPIMVNGKLTASLSAARSHARQWNEDDRLLVQATAERTWPGVQQARADAALREAARRKDEFLAMLAHELRNPLAPISAAAQLLQFGKFDETRVLAASAIISRQVSHMTGLVDDLLDVSRVTTGMIVLEKTWLDINQIVTDAAEQVTPQLRARRHQLQLQITPDETLVMGDRKRLVQVLANLLGNAAKYTPEGGLIIVRTSVHADHVNVAVRDNGIGMAPELKARAFDLFAQAERTSDRSLGGLGLGLALVKSLVELHRGTVTCDSAGLGLGSQFTICLPRAALATTTPPSAAVHAPAGNAAAALRILVVDDNVDAAAMLAMLLEASGHEVIVENGSVSALARASVERPQVCLLDIGLPGMDGNELARRLRADPATAGALLVAITGYGQQADQQQTLAAGFDHHFLKPVDMVKLNAVLAGWRQPGTYSSTMTSNPP